MIAAEIIEIGDNLLSAVIAITTLATLVFNTVKSQRAQRAAEEARDQLRNNGGSTALDKIEAGLTEINTRLDDHSHRLARIEQR